MYHHKQSQGIDSWSNYWQIFWDLNAVSEHTRLGKESWSFFTFSKAYLVLHLWKGKDDVIFIFEILVKGGLSKSRTTTFVTKQSRGEFRGTNALVL